MWILSIYLFVSPLTCRCTSRVHGWYDRAQGLWFPCHCCETPFRWWNCGAAVSAAHGGMLVSLWLSARLRRILTDESACKCASLAQAHTSSHWEAIVTVICLCMCFCVRVCVCLALYRLISRHHSLMILFNCITHTNFYVCVCICTLLIHV